MYENNFLSILLSIFVDVFNIFTKFHLQTYISDFSTSFQRQVKWNNNLILNHPFKNSTPVLPLVPVQTPILCSPTNPVTLAVTDVTSFAILIPFFTHGATRRCRWLGSILSIILGVFPSIKSSAF